MKKPLKITLITVSIILALIIIAVTTFTILNSMGRLQFHKNDRNIKNNSVTEEEYGILYKGNKYALDNDVISFLLIGVDKSSLDSSLGIGINGQADTLMVVAINTKSRDVTVIPISRETLVDVNNYNTAGKYVGVEKKQICLAFAYGKTTEESSENVLRSVSRALYGINVSSYITMDLNALEKISNAVGSIDVYVNEDYYDPDSRIYYKAGRTISVKGINAVNYIHWRTDNVDANNYRMERQKSFMTAFVNKTSNEISEDYSKVITYYNLMAPYVSTNITLSQATYLVNSCIKLNLGDSLDFESIPGTSFVRSGYSAFTPNEETLTDIIVKTFYKKIVEQKTEKEK
ncbi:MAG: LCP family protein [Clostridia bacterium]|nr:LCP family protein [Clostridia bacterium]